MELGLLSWWVVTETLGLGIGFALETNGVGIWVGGGLLGLGAVVDDKARKRVTMSLIVVSRVLTVWWTA
jgi:hypothetical protein